MLKLWNSRTRSSQVHYVPREIAMSEANPLVSVIIPVYNYERYLAQAIKSVLAQTYRPVEIIVVDDGSTDGSAEVTKRFTSPVKYCFQHHSGIGAARNCGIHLTQGDLIAFLDADDLWMKDKLARQMKALNDNPELDMVFGYARQFYSPDLAKSMKEKVHYPQETMPAYCAGTLLIKRATFLSVGFFATDCCVGEFIDWYLKAMELGLTSLMLPAVLMKRRVHSKNTVICHTNSKTDYLRILKASLDRRRGAKL